jgi:hypothetical protein
MVRYGYVRLVISSQRSCSDNFFAIYHYSLAHFSENWGFVSMAPLLGGNLFSILFGRNLDAHVTGADSRLMDLSIPPRSPRPERQCLQGRVCYASTLVVTTFACCLALVLSLIAAWRDRQRSRIAEEYVSLPQVIWEDDSEAGE